MLHAQQRCVARRGSPPLDPRTVRPWPGEALLPDDGGVSTSQPDLVAVVDRLVALAEQRWSLITSALPEDEAVHPTHGPGARARELLEHSRSYLRPRARDLDAPLLVVLLGPTGSGKSTLLNTIAGGPASRTGVLRPTTRVAVVLASEADIAALRSNGALTGLGPDRLEQASLGARPGVVVVDAPDIDSVERANRALADTLLELADLCVFVTTATRYADRVPWDVLARIEQRRLPLVVVVNRLPPGEDAGAVLEDVRRLIHRQALTAPSETTPDTAAPTPPPLEVVGVPEGALDPSGVALRSESVRPLLDRIDLLASDRGSRRALAEQALAGAVAGLVPLVHAVADDLDHEAIDVESLRRTAGSIYADELRAVMDQLRRGDVLREEVIRQWHSFVGADQVTRAFSSGIGRARGALLSIIRGTPSAPVAAVTQGATEDLTALVAAHAADAARRAAAAWSANARTAAKIGADPGLWSPSPSLPDSTRDALAGWLGVIATDVAETGASKRGVARGVSLGVNAGAVTVMLGVFAHTGGLTGAEVGIAAATAFLNQKLLNALFGEAAVIEMIDRARAGLTRALEGVFAAELARFERLVSDGTELRGLSAALREVAGAVPAIGPR